MLYRKKKNMAYEKNQIQDAEVTEKVSPILNTLALEKPEQPERISCRTVLQGI